MEKITFGEFIRKKRLEQSITLRRMADQLDVSAPFLSDVEKGRRNPLDLDKMNQLADFLHMNSQERDTMYDLAGRDRDTIAPDLPEYIKDRGYVTAALRSLRDLDAGEKEWQEFVDELKRRKG
ncbi:predicted transcriptional regulator [Clostridium sp. SY8519]|uniref:helix-turn-helix domain-containing protein n=1 Tax=Clostridium sp. (strain SY8519) TaxID=1042156 RepID=UPI0002171F19|nr:helix-turn-helix transcriptional regulator [Clostridium sp. SY8519]BAK47249.1 predicted transcriptional regulator [Clostridium sp. SY8519]